MSYENYRQPSNRLLPDVVKNLLIINVIMYLATIFFQGQGLDLIDKLGLHYFTSEKFKVYQFITYMFMHDSRDLTHIFFNMLALYMFGGAIENMWGGKKFFTYYLLTGLGAALTHYAIVYFQINPTITFFNDYINHPDMSSLYQLVSSYGSEFNSDFRDVLQTDPGRALQLSTEVVQQIKMDLMNAPVVIGASGAIFGLLLAYGMLFPNSILYLFFALPIKAKYAVIVFGVLELYFGIRSNDNVAHFAHLGGLVTGIIIILIWRAKDRRKRRDYFN